MRSRPMLPLPGGDSWSPARSNMRFLGACAGHGGGGSASMDAALGLVVGVMGLDWGMKNEGLGISFALVLSFLGWQIKWREPTEDIGANFVHMCAPKFLFFSRARSSFFMGRPI